MGPLPSACLSFPWVARTRTMAPLPLEGLWYPAHCQLHSQTIHATKAPSKPSKISRCSSLPWSLPRSPNPQTSDLETALPVRCLRAASELRAGAGHRVWAPARPLAALQPSAAFLEQSSPGPSMRHFLHCFLYLWQLQLKLSSSLQPSREPFRSFFLSLSLLLLLFTAPPTKVQIAIFFKRKKKSLGKKRSDFINSLW